MKRLILVAILIAGAALAMRQKPDPQPVEDPAATAAARRAEGEAAIRARRAELRAQRERREGKGDGVMRAAYETCRRNHGNNPKARCDQILNPTVHKPTREQPFPEGSGAIDISKLYNSKP